MSGLKGWEKAVPIKRPDSLCASSFTYKAFIPSYERLYCKPDMNLMVSMEYRRMWFQERAAWELEAYPKIKKESASKNLEDKWRENLKDKMTKKNKGKENSDANKKKPKKKYSKAVSKTDSGLEYVRSPPQRDSREKSALLLSSGEPSSSYQEGVVVEPQEVESLTSPDSRNEIAQGQGSFMGRGDTNEEEQSSSQSHPSQNDLPTASTTNPQGNELVAKCPRCAVFHPLREKCPGAVLCKDQAFRERMMRNMCS